MALIDEIIATGLPLIDHDAIAAALSAGRTKTVPTEIGNGMIIETIGLAAGNALLDAIYGNADFRYVKPLLEQGRLRIDSPLVRATLDGMVGAGVITQAEANALKALAVQADPVTAYDVGYALQGVQI